jgi:hypothetical protein
MFVPETLREALDLLGERVADRQLAYELVIVGGGGLQLLGVIARPTKDVDVMAVVVDGRYQTAEPLPPPLLDAVADVARILTLPANWLNSGPTSQLRFGLPDGFADRVTTERFSTLTVHLASRFDQTCLKLYAAADDKPNGKHFQDLQRLRPGRDELARAAHWVKAQDASEVFASFVDQVIAALDGGGDE